MNQFLSDIASELVVGVLAIIATALWHRWRSLDGKIGRGRLTVSVDRKRVATEIDGEIYISDERGTRNLTKSPAPDEYALWAPRPNTHWIAFMRKNGEVWQVIVANVKTGKMFFPLTGKGDSRPLSWTGSCDLQVDMGGSTTTVWRREIEKWLK